MKKSGKALLIFPILLALIALVVLAWAFVRHDPMHMSDFPGLLRKQFTAQETSTPLSESASASGQASSTQSAAPVLTEDLYQETRAALQLIAQSSPLSESHIGSLAMLDALIAKFVRLDSQNKWGALRQALQDDRQDYRRVTPPDFLALSAVLDELILSSANLPLISSAQLIANQSVSANAAKTSNAANTANTAAQNSAADSAAASYATGLSWQTISQGLWLKFAEIVRIRRLDDLETRMAAENRSALMTQKLQLHLQSARMSLLARQSAVLNRDLDQIEKLLGLAFEPTAPEVLDIKKKINVLRNETTGRITPSVAKSLAALEVLYAQGQSISQKAVQ